MSKEDREVLAMVNGADEEGSEPATAKTVVAGKFAKKRPKTEFRQMLSEVAGWTGFGGMALGGMLAGVVPMGAAVPVFIGCFGWVAIRVDRFFRG